MNAPAYSVIVPVLNEAPRIRTCIGNIRQCLPGSEIIVVDGGSGDGTPELARRAGAMVLERNASRGGQCHAGAQAARGAVLVFLHADCLLEPDAAAVIDRDFTGKGLAVAKLSARFDSPAFKYRVRSWFARRETLFTSFGDQGIVVSGDRYRAGERIPDMKLFEDVEFFRRARKKGRIAVLETTIHLSIRRFEAKGCYRSFVKDGILIFLYLLGMPHERLYARYYRKPGATP